MTTPAEILCALLNVMCVEPSHSLGIATEPVSVMYPRLCVAVVDDRDVPVIVNDRLDEATFKILVSRIRKENQEPVQCPTN